MFTKKSIGVALACALALGAWSGTALANPININGVQIDPDSGFDLTIGSGTFRESSVNTVGQTLMGYGKISQINGTDENTFCPSCDLTFTFSYTVKSIDSSTDSNGHTTSQVVFDDGLLNFYVEPDNTFNTIDPTSASNGSLWLTLDGHTAPYGSFTTLGELYATVLGPAGNPQSQSSGFGLLDVAGGSAASYFDTNTQADGADLALNSSFSFKPNSNCGGVSADPTSICHFPISGSGNLKGDTAMPVPEPGELGLLGLGLVGLGFFIRRRRKEIEDRS